MRHDVSHARYADSYFSASCAAIIRELVDQLVRGQSIQSRISRCAMAPGGGVFAASPNDVASIASVSSTENQRQSSSSRLS